MKKGISSNSQKVVDIVIGVLFLSSIIVIILYKIKWWDKLLAYYLIFGIFNLILGFIQIYRKVIELQALKDFGLSQLWQTYKGKRFFGKIKDVSSILFLSLSSILTWPIDIWHFHRMHKRNKYELFSFESLMEVGYNTIPHLRSIYVLFSVTIVYFTSYIFNIPEYSVKLYFMVVAIYLIVFQLSFIVGSGAVAKELRKRNGSTIGKFLIIAFSDFLSLLLVYNGLLYFNADVFIDFNELGLLAKEFVTFEIFTSFEFNSNIEILLKLNGATFYFIIFKTLFRYNDFIRTEKDYESIAFSLSVTGKYDESLNFIRKTNYPTPKTILISAVNYLGKREYTNSLNEYKRFFNSLLIEDRQKQISVIMSNSMMYNQIDKILEGFKTFNEYFNFNEIEIVNFFVISIISNSKNKLKLVNKLLSNNFCQSYPMVHAMLLAEEKNNPNKALQVLNKIDYVDETSIDFLYRNYLILICELRTMKSENIYLIIDEWIENNQTFSMNLIEKYKEENNIAYLVQIFEFYLNILNIAYNEENKLKNINMLNKIIETIEEKIPRRNLIEISKIISETVDSYSESE